ncbi:MAG TPA: FliH/SctL family protein [Phycisphaerae bacterium]|nr:FliH/SctL family protein [Phycisphaerae bacterium]
MPLLKAHSAPRLRESSIVMDLSDLEREATQIVKSAKAQADEMLAAARAAAQREAAAIREQARAQGHAEGLVKGLEEGRKSGHDAAVAETSALVKDLTARWSQSLEIIHQHMPAHAADAKSDLLRLALAIAARVTHQEALRNKKVAEAVAADALALAATARRITLLANPAEADLLNAYLPELVAKLRTIDSVQLLPDPSITPGGVIAQFGAGEIDARLETQLQRITDELLAAE